MADLDWARSTVSAAVRRALISHQLVAGQPVIVQNPIGSRPLPARSSHPRARTLCHTRCLSSTASPAAPRRRSSRRGRWSWRPLRACRARYPLHPGCRWQHEEAGGLRPTLAKPAVHPAPLEQARRVGHQKKPRSTARSPPPGRATRANRGLAGLPLRQGQKLSGTRSRCSSRYVAFRHRPDLLSHHGPVPLLAGWAQSTREPLGNPPGQWRGLLYPVRPPRRQWTPPADPTATRKYWFARADVSGSRSIRSSYRISYTGQTGSGGQWASHSPVRASGQHVPDSGARDLDLWTARFSRNFVRSRVRPGDATSWCGCVRGR